MDGTFGVRQFGGNVLEAFIGIAAQSTPQGSCVTVLLVCGDPFKTSTLTSGTPDIATGTIVS